MPRKKSSKRRRPELLVRFIDITVVSAGISLSAGQEKGKEPHLHSTDRIELTGTMDEPIRDTLSVEIVLYAADAPKPAAGHLRGQGWFMACGPQATLRSSLPIASSTGCGPWRSQDCSRTRELFLRNAFSLGRSSQHSVLDAAGGVVNRCAFLAPSDTAVVLDLGGQGKTGHLSTLQNRPFLVSATEAD
jgi:hypothetical protein